MTTPGTNFIGVNISGPHARAALIDSEGRILERRDADITPENFVPQLANLRLNCESRTETLPRLACHPGTRQSKS